MSKKIAVILFNLGGPDNLAAVKPFLFNLFNDRAIVNLPQPFRWLLAQLLSSRREKSAQQNYALIGCKSPILEHTNNQAENLEKSLNLLSQDQYKVFVCMRYWHPFTEDIVTKIKDEKFAEVILLPLYPHFSTTTTGSSFNEWNRVCYKLKLNVPTKKICCYPTHNNFIKAHVEIIKKIYENYSGKNKLRILFSAHGLPQKVIDKGDPYQYQIEKTVKDIVNNLVYQNLDYQICYQSKVGPLKWLEPSTAHEIIRARKDNVDILLVPIAFVSEHVETLVELDIEYKQLAISHGIKNYLRAPALETNENFIKCLIDLCLNPQKNSLRICQPQNKCCLHSR